MWIKKLYATFGKLSNETLSLDRGLNVIYGKNESGKSTWSSFIRAMFYGISTREQRKEGFLPDKEKFLPWNGEPMYGKMELSERGGDMTIERTSAKSGVFTKVSSTYDDNGKEAPVGEELVGVSKSVYEKTAFIRQAAIGVTGDAETERRILSIASSGDESVSAGEVINRLKKRQRTLRSTGKNGEIPKLEEAISALSKEISDNEAREAEILNLSESLDAQKVQEKKLSRAFLIAKAEEEKKKRSYISSANEEFASASKRLAEVAEYPTRRELDMFLEKKAEWKRAMFEKEQGERVLNLLREELSKSGNEISASPFANMAEEEATRAVERDIQALELSEKKKKSPVPSIILLAVAAVLAVLGVVINYLIFIPAFLFVVIGIVLFLIPPKKDDSKKSEIISKYGTSDASAIHRLLSDYHASCARNRELAAKLSAEEAEDRKKTTIVEICVSDMKNISARFANGNDFDEAERRLRELSSLREEAYTAEAAARAKVEALAAATDIAEPVIEYDESEIPEKSAEEIEAEILALRNEIKNFEIAIATKRASQSSFSSVARDAEREELKEKLDAANFEYDALSLAIDTIDEAEVELKNRFSPEIEKRTSEIFRHLCGGNFSLVRIKNSDFDMQVSKGAASAPREYLSLSQGTVDELYFALRLALFETIVPEENSPPLVLDDVFVNFDDERMKKALDLLLEKSRERQIILFSCHTREAEYLKDRANVREL